MAASLLTWKLPPAKLAFLKFKSPLCLKPFWVPRDAQDKAQRSSPGTQALPRLACAWFSKLIRPPFLTPSTVLSGSPVCI